MSQMIRGSTASITVMLIGWIEMAVAGFLKFELQYLILVFLLMIFQYSAFVFLDALKDLEAKSI